MPSPTKTWAGKAEQRRCGSGGRQDEERNLDELIQSWGSWDMSLISLFGNS
jgi:hypothetical protein